MKVLVKFKAFLQKVHDSLLPQASKSEHSYKDMLQQANERIARMERNYLVLLKRVLEMDGVQLVVSSKSKSMSQTVIQTTAEDVKGLNDAKPTIH